MTGWKLLGDRNDYKGQVTCCPMKTLGVLLILLSAIPAVAKESRATDCSLSYSVVTQDSLGNVNEGIPAHYLKWATEDLPKKYPGMCYKPTHDPSVTVILFIGVTPDTYHGTRVVTNTANDTGTINGTNGSATYTGTTTSSTAVPYSFDYGKYLLTVETWDQQHQLIGRQKFEQDGIYSTMYGIPLGGRGHHPAKAVIEDALKWVAAGGLNSQQVR